MTLEPSQPEWLHYLEPPREGDQEWSPRFFLWRDAFANVPPSIVVSRRQLDRLKAAFGDSVQLFVSAYVPTVEAVSKLRTFFTRPEPKYPNDPSTYKWYPTSDDNMFCEYIQPLRGHQVRNTRRPYRR